MKQKVKGGSGNQIAGRDIDNQLSVDLRIDNRGAIVDQRVSIGTMFAGPVHIHLTVDRAEDVGEG